MERDTFQTMSILRSAHVVDFCNNNVHNVDHMLSDTLELGNLQKTACISTIHLMFCTLLLFKLSRSKVTELQAGEDGLHIWFGCCGSFSGINSWTDNIHQRKCHHVKMETYPTLQSKWQTFCEVSSANFVAYFAWSLWPTKSKRCHLACQLRKR